MASADSVTFGLYQLSFGSSFEPTNLISASAPDIELAGDPAIFAETYLCLMEATETQTISMYVTFATNLESPEICFGRSLGSSALSDQISHRIKDKALGGVSQTGSRIRQNSEAPNQ